MALQIRRGTSTEVISNQFVPAEGELIYTTDTKRVFVGDGFTIGGVDITSSGGTGGALTTNLDLNNQNITGIGDISISGLIVTDSEFRGDLRGNVIGDLAGNVVGTVTGELEGSVFGAGSTLLVDGDNNLIVGDVSGSIINENGDYVLFNQPNSPAMFYGTVSGDVVGDVVGSILAVDSAVLVNGDTKTLSNTHITIQENNISSIDNTIFIRGDIDQTLIFEQIQSSPFIKIHTILDSSFGGPSRMNFIGHKTSITNPGIPEIGDYIGAVAFSAVDPTANDLASVGLFTIGIDNNGIVNQGFASGKSTIIVAGGNDLATRDFKYLTFDSKGQLAVNHQDAQATLDVNGFAKLAILTAAPVNPADGMIAIADGVSWNPAGTGKSVMVVHLSGDWRIAATAP